MKWIIFDLFNRVKVEIAAAHYDDAIAAARAAFPDFRFDCGHVKNRDERFNEPALAMIGKLDN